MLAYPFSKKIPTNTNSNTTRPASTPAPLPPSNHLSMLVSTDGSLPVPKFTLKEVSKHTSAEDLWMIIDGKVYNVTQFIGDHPGGAEVLFDCAGIDATLSFDDVGHSEDAIDMLKECCLGELEDADKQFLNNIKDIDRSTTASGTTTSTTTRRSNLKFSYSSTDSISGDPTTVTSSSSSSPQSSFLTTSPASSDTSLPSHKNGTVGVSASLSDATITNTAVETSTSPNSSKTNQDKTKIRKKKKAVSKGTIPKINKASKHTTPGSNLRRGITNDVNTTSPAGQIKSNFNRDFMDKMSVPVLLCMSISALVIYIYLQTLKHAY